MWEDAKQHHVTRLYLIFSEEGSDYLWAWSGGVGASSKDQMRHTSGKGFTPCTLHSMGAVPQCLLCGDCKTASCNVFLWKFSPAPAHMGLDVFPSCTEMCPEDQCRFKSGWTV